jgi:hypothetical protein
MAHRPILRAMPERLLAGLCLALAGALLPAAVAGAEPALDPEPILRALARPAPSRTPFVEVRGSAMLKTPLRVQGEYRREADGRLVRQVLSPYVETTTLSAGQAVIERSGRPPRTIALAQVPELAAVQAGFGALLAGDRELLLRTYSVQASGLRERWHLRLVPRQAQMAAGLRHIDLYGRGSELRCVESQPAKGSAQRTLMAGAAAQASGVTETQALAALCRDPGA